MVSKSFTEFTARSGCTKKVVTTEIVAGIHEILFEKVKLECQSVCQAQLDYVVRCGTTGKDG